MRLIEIHPGRHLRIEAFDEVTLHPGRIAFGFRARMVAVKEWCARKPCEGGVSAEERIHAEGEYDRLVAWLADPQAMPLKFTFDALPKGPDSYCEAGEPVALTLAGEPPEGGTPNAGGTPSGEEQVFA